MLSLRLLEGINTEKNEKEAFEWCQKAAQQGYINAQYQLGQMYFEGIGVEENYEEAFKWFKKAADDNNFDALYMLGHIFSRIGCFK